MLILCGFSDFEFWRLTEKTGCFYKGLKRDAFESVINTVDYRTYEELKRTITKLNIAINIQITVPMRN